MIEHVTPTPVVTHIEELLEPPVPHVQAQNFEVVNVISQERLSERSSAPVPVVHATPAPAVKYVAPAPVTEYVTPLRALGFTNVVNLHVSLTTDDEIVDVPAPEIVEEILEVLPALVQAVHAAPARVIEHAAPMPLDEYDASMMQILESFHHSVKQIGDVPDLASTDHHSASASSALREAQETMTERAAAEFFAEEEAKPATKKAQQRKHKR